MALALIFPETAARRMNTRPTRKVRGWALTPGSLTPELSLPRAPMFISENSKHSQERVRSVWTDPRHARRCIPFSPSTLPGPSWVTHRSFRR